ncbi:MAG TPA: winged helix-turn-helix domain-containing protein [Terriglobales bacterium]|nr:winged helix-turn-helix domain-containing protein [Terriglobales bacterium]
MGQLSSGELKVHMGSQAMSMEAFTTGGNIVENRNEGETLSIGDFRIDLQQRRVKIRNQEIHLGGDEFELLVYLLNHPKRVVTSQTRLSTHWEGGRVHQARFLQVLLSLQKKLDAANAGVHYIRTEPLLVYRFDPRG